MKQPLKPKMNRLIAMQGDFAEIEKLFRTLRNDDLNEVKDNDGKWILSQQNLEGTHYALLSSIEGWCDFFKALADMYLNDYDEKPIRKLITKLRLDQPITLEFINEAEQILKPQRQLFLSVPSDVFNATRARVFELREEKVAA